MNTSYFAKYKGNKGVSIAVGTPTWVKYPVYRPLCPSWELVKLVKENGDYETYTKEYKKQLNALNPSQVLKDLGEDAVLLCWEKSGDFCHRHLVAEWFKEQLGIIIKEI